MQISKHTNVPLYKRTDQASTVAGYPTGSIWVKTTTPNLGANWRVKRFNGDTEIWDAVDAPLYATNHEAIYNLDSTNGGTGLSSGDIYAQTNADESTDPLGRFKLFVRNASGATTITSGKIAAGATWAAATYSITISESLAGQAAMSGNKVASFTLSGGETAAVIADAFVQAINNAGFTNVSASRDSQFRVTITHKLGGEIRFTDTSSAMTKAGFSGYYIDALTVTANIYDAPADASEDYVASLWKPLSYTASDDAPTALAADGALWYSSIVDEVDMLVHDGNKWVGLLHADSPYYNADSSLAPDPEGPIVSAT
jgi:hypothetical protein